MRTLRLSPWSVFQRLSAVRTGKVPTGGASRRWVPSGGWSGAETPFRPPGGSNPIAAFRQLGFSCRMAPAEDASLPCLAVRHRACVSELSGVPSGPRQSGQRRRASRGICGSPSPSREEERRVFRRCCGHRCRIVWFKISHLFQGFGPESVGGFDPSDALRLRLMPESCKAFL